MADKSKIEWTDASWTPIRARNKSTGKVGWHCEHATPGCEHCYAESMNARLGTGLPFKPGHRKDIELFLDEDMLLQPLRWKKPRMIFVCSMTDLFADFVPDEWIDKVFAVMALCPQHTFQVLTKRAERMRAYFNGPYPNGDGVMARIADATFAFCPQGKLPAAFPGAERGIGPNGAPEFGWRRFLNIGPLPNVWLGVSAEDQTRADERIPYLLDTPAAVRFVSAEPLLGQIDFSRLAYPKSCECEHYSPSLCAFNASVYCEGCCEGPEAMNLGRLSWVIVGGESGPGARPMHPDWVRSVRDQCQDAGVPFFMKQHGEWHPSRDHDPHQFKECDRTQIAINIEGRTESRPTEVLRLIHEGKQDGWEGMCRVGKRAAGRLLDGQEHNEMPERANG